MTPEQSLTLELASRDLGDITALESFEPFNRYYVRRLSEKRAAIENRFYLDPPAKVDAPEREILRRLLIEYDGLISLLVVEKVFCGGEITRAAENTRKESFRQGDTRPATSGKTLGYD